MRTCDRRASRGDAGLPGPERGSCRALTARGQWGTRSAKVTAVGPRAVTGKSPSAPTGTRARGQVPGRAWAAAPAGGGRGIPGTAGGTPVKWTRSVAPGWRGGRVCGDLWLPSLRVLGNSSCTSEATAPGAGSLNPPLKFAFGGVLQDSGPHVSAIQFQGSGDCARSSAAWRGQGPCGAAGFARRGLPVHQK